MIPPPAQCTVYDTLVTYLQGYSAVQVRPWGLWSISLQDYIHAMIIFKIIWNYLTHRRVSSIKGGIPPKVIFY